MAGPILVGKLGWEDVTSLRIWVRPKRLRRTRQGRLRAATGTSAVRRAARRVVRRASHRARRGVSELALRRLAAPVRSLRERRRLGRRHACACGTASRRPWSASGRPRRPVCSAAACALVDADLAVAMVNPGEERAYLLARLRADAAHDPLHRQASHRGRARAAEGARAPGGSRSATSTSSDAQARLRHAEARPRAIRSSRRRCRRCARSPRASTSSSCSATRAEPRRRAGERARARVRRVDAAAARSAIHARARARAAAAARSRSSRTWSRSTPCSRRRSCGRCACRSSSGTRTGRDTSLVRAAERLATVVCLGRPARRSRSSRGRCMPIGHGIDVGEFSCADTPEPHERAARARARPLLAGKGLETDPARRGARARRRARGQRRGVRRDGIARRRGLQDRARRARTRARRRCGARRCRGRGRRCRRCFARTRRR